VLTWHPAPRVPRGYDIVVEAGQSAGGVTESRQGLAVLVAARSRIADVQRNAEIADFDRLPDRLAFEDVESAQRREIYLIRDQILLNAEGYAGSLMGQLAAIYAQRYRDAGRLGARPGPFGRKISTPERAGRTPQ
jgi:hypothetical protein